MYGIDKSFVESFSVVALRVKSARVGKIELSCLLSN